MFNKPFTSYTKLIKCFKSGYNKSIVRSYSVRVRFAPSPTGFLHLGGLRTALYNYLFAKSHNGTFILRIEDTDQTRIVDTAAQSLVDDLKWAGIQCDEGPHTPGDCGPYVQSQRLQIYHEKVQELLESGAAYKCFCTPTRLDVLRREATKSGQIPKYDNKCRHLSTGQIKARLSEGKSYCVRFKLTPDVSTFNDLIYGDITYDVMTNEGDPIVVKSDGFPTYHFANVVDDHVMRITHVLRGVEWQVSTIKHILLHRAFSWTPPKYGHLPLLLNPDGSKLSKRQNDIRIEHYRERGVFAQALINYITFSGGGFERDSSLKGYQMDELIETFRISRINPHSTKLAPEKLAEFNRLELQNRLKDPTACASLIAETTSLLHEHFRSHSVSENVTLQLDATHIESVLNWSQHRINYLSDLTSEQFRFLWTRPASVVFPDEKYRRVLERFVGKLESGDVILDKVNLQKCLRALAKECGVDFKAIMSFLRLILSGLKTGPSVAEIIEVLGQEATIERLKTPLKQQLVRE